MTDQATELVPVRNPLVALIAKVSRGHSWRPWRINGGADCSCGWSPVEPHDGETSISHSEWRVHHAEKVVEALNAHVTYDPGWKCPCGENVLLGDYTHEEHRDGGPVPPIRRDAVVIPPVYGEWSEQPIWDGA